MKINLPKPLVEFCFSCPHPIYAVGGIVRNALLGKEGGDLDICGPKSVEEICSGRAEFTPINKSLGTAQIKYGGVSFEYTRFRQEKYQSGGAHTPSSVEFVEDIKEDAIRRDFTINSIYYDIKNDKIIDILDGVKDLEQKMLRSYDAKNIFSADGLRLMRLCRFAAELGLEIDLDTLNAAMANRQNLKDIAAERKRDELDKILYADQKYGIEYAHYRGLNLLHQLGLFEYILPSMQIMDIPQNPKYHKYSVLKHTFKAVKYADKSVRLAALMHDTGKPVCKKRDGNMYGHAAESERIVKRELGERGLKYPKKVVEETARLVRLHMYDVNRQTSDSKMRLFAAKNFDILQKIELLAIADGKATGNIDFIPPRFMYFGKILVSEGAPLSVKDLKISGLDAINAGLKGSQIKTALERLWRECVINPKLNNRKWLLSQLNNWKL